MNVLEAIQKRRSIRHYKPDDIPEDVLERLLNALRLAPSGGNKQPWKFIVVKDKVTKSSITAACTWKTEDGNQIYQNWIDEAPVVIIACGLVKEAFGVYHKNSEAIITSSAAFEDKMALPSMGFESCFTWDLAIALDHLTLAAVAEGLGTCWIGGLYEPQLKAILSIPEDVRAPMAIVLGYPVAWPEPRPRKSLDEIICYDKYS